MCSIVGSFNIETLCNLSQLNAYRGTHSHSLYAFDRDMNVSYSHKGFGALDVSAHTIPKDCYIVAHQQAPTTEAKDMNSIHPAEVDGSLLWHNGIIKQDDVRRLQSELSSVEKWDTKLLLLNYITTGSFDGLDGTFACVMHTSNKLYILRNEISPLFMNASGDVSSTKFDDSFSVEPNKVLHFTPFDASMIREEGSFKTKENPYFFM